MQIHSQCICKVSFKTVEWAKSYPKSASWEAIAAWWRCHHACCLCVLSGQIRANKCGKCVPLLLMHCSGMELAPAGRIWMPSMWLVTGSQNSPKQPGSDMWLVELVKMVQYYVKVWLVGWHTVNASLCISRTPNHLLALIWLISANRGVGTISVCGSATGQLCLREPQIVCHFAQMYHHVAFLTTYLPDAT